MGGEERLLDAVAHDPPQEGSVDLEGLVYGDTPSDRDRHARLGSTTELVLAELALHERLADDGGCAVVTHGIHTDQIADVDLCRVVDHRENGALELDAGGAGVGGQLGGALGEIHAAERIVDGHVDLLATRGLGAENRPVVAIRLQERVAVLHVDRGVPGTLAVDLTGLARAAPGPVDVEHRGGSELAWLGEGTKRDREALALQEVVQLVRIERCDGLDDILEALDNRRAAALDASHQSLLEFVDRLPHPTLTDDLLEGQDGSRE